MTEYVRIRMNDGSYEVDLTNLNPDVLYVRSNPLFIVPMGTDYQRVFNLQIISVRITVNFDLVDGNAVGSNFDKLVEMSNKSGGTPTDPSFVAEGYADEGLIFEWGSRSYYVNIESLAAGTRAGRLNLMQGCSMVLVPVSEV